MALAEPPRRALLRLPLAAAVLSVALAGTAVAQGVCVDEGRLTFGFFADFKPVSYSEVLDPGAAGFNVHRGFEADLVSGLERFEDAGLAFTRRAIPLWQGIWLRSQAEFDVVGGGITILDSRMLDAAGETVVRFTDGHVAFRQSLLVRAEDVARLPTHDALTSAERVGVLAGTTGEARMLQLVGLADGAGTLAAGTRIQTTAGEVVADGSAAFRITAAEATANLEGRQRLTPPSDSQPQVIYLAGDAEQIAALAAGEVDAIARGEIGNSDAAVDSGGRFAVTAIDPEAEFGGFTVRADRTALLACLNERIGWLTAGGSLGYGAWRQDPGVFLARAAMWNALMAELGRRGEATRPLAAIFGGTGAVRFEAASSDPALVEAEVVGNRLALALDERGDGAATVMLTAIDSAGAATTLRFNVPVQPARRQLRGWRNAVGQADP